MSIAEVLGDEPDIQTRFNVEDVDVRRRGDFCTTPRGRRGVCAYISDPECEPVLNRIRRNGITSRIINYLRRAIQRPCGFEGFDFTLCCRSTGGGGGGFTPRPTTRPTTTRRTTRRTTTTTRRPSVQCGQSFSTRIIGGFEPSPGDWPWMAVLGRPSGSSFTVVCGGILIDETHILTAAHCFPDNRNSRITHARLGEHDISRTSDGRHVDIQISRVRNHEGYSQSTLKNDISILTLSSPVRFVPNRIAPICLPDTRGQNLLNRRDPVITGWGSTRVGGGTVQTIQQASIPLESTTSCNRKYQGVSRPITIGNADQLCAGEGRTDTCTGDSGGPMMMLNNQNRWMVVGITSFGVECARQDFPGVYTRVDNFLSWIRRNT